MSLGRPFGLFFYYCCALQAQQLPAVSSLEAPAIQIVEGDGAINSIRLHRGHDPVVRITTSGGEPVVGATVTFLLPASGPSGTFAGSSGLSLTVQSDERGMAAARGMRPNNIAGQFHIRVNTMWHASPAATTITQTNAEPVAHSSHTKTYVI